MKKRRVYKIKNVTTPEQEKKNKEAIKKAIEKSQQLKKERLAKRLFENL